LVISERRLAMRQIGHWTPRYVVNRVLWEVYERRNTDKPWLNPVANRLLPTLLRPTDQALEWGSGQSTLWLARHVGHLTSVEDDRGWYERITGRLAATQTTNVQYKLVESPPAGDGARTSDYVSTVFGFSDESLDFALVDGSAREYCAEAVLPKIAPGGVLIVDDTHGFFDHRTHAPISQWRKGPKNEVWASVWHTVSTWRVIWTSNGLKDTTIFVRPSSTSERTLRSSRSSLS
jgi:hypothetical protein